MPQVMEHYGKGILVFVIILALIGIMAFLLTSDGVVAKQFQTLITKFFEQANAASGITKAS